MDWGSITAPIFFETYKIIAVKTFWESILVNNTVKGEEAFCHFYAILVIKAMIGVSNMIANVAFLIENLGNFI